MSVQYCILFLREWRFRGDKMKMSGLCKREFFFFFFVFSVMSKKFVFL